VKEIFKQCGEVVSFVKKIRARKVVIFPIGIQEITLTLEEPKCMTFRK
jgi:hypothetical protein